MNNDETNSISAEQGTTQEILQNNLISALTRLQYTEFEKELLDGNQSQEADAKPESFFGFDIGNYHFMVSASCFCEVFVETAIAPVPNAPTSLVGLSNIRGVLIPVYQIHSALNIQLPKRNIIFVVGKGESSIGLLIDSLPISLSLSAHQREAVLKQENDLLQQFVQQNYFASQNHWLLLDGARLARQLVSMASVIHKSNTSLSIAGASAYM